MKSDPLRKPKLQGSETMGTTFGDTLSKHLN